MKKMHLACVCALALFVAGPANAGDPKPTPRATASESPADAKTKAAFLALAEDDRKSLQDGLGWLGFYNGVTDGAYGKRTIDALVAWQTSVKAPGDGIVTVKQLAAIKDAATKAKAAAGFELVDNAATGARIGAPTKLLLKHDGVELHVESYSANLDAVYKAQTADAPNRKVTYKYLRPGGFFVIAGEEGDAKFYRRAAAAPAGWAKPSEVHGFTFRYPKDRAKALDPVALAVANSFDPFPSAAPLPPTREATPQPTPTPEGPKLTATALIVAPGMAVTTLAAGRCKAPIIDGKPAEFVEGAGGLTRLKGEFGAGASPPAIGSGDGELLALSVAPAGASKTNLQVTTAIAAPAAHVIAALGGAASGAPLFDRGGRLVGFVAPFEAPVSRAGVALATPHATFPPSGLGDSGAAPAAPVSAPQLAAKMRAAVVGVFCGA